MNGLIRKGLDSPGEENGPFFGEGVDPDSEGHVLMRPVSGAEGVGSPFLCKGQPSPGAQAGNVTASGWGRTPGKRRRWYCRDSKYSI